MNCRYAREIVNLLLDGEGHPLAAEAEVHVRECAECREWQEGMEQALEMLQTPQVPPMPDIASMVMTRLPAAHPASTRTREAWLSPPGVLPWLGAGWLIGAIILSAFAMMLLPMLKFADLAPAVEAIKSIVTPIGALIVAARAAITPLIHSVMAVARAIGLGPALGVPLCLDLALLAIVLLVWHRRRLAVNACLI